MQDEEGKFGAVRRNVYGEPCSCCGSRSYKLVLRSVKETQRAQLFARCAHCNHLGEINEKLGHALETNEIRTS
jgi:hypothetical protein